MTSAKVIIKNSTGLHARPVTELVNKASSFISEIFIKKGDRMGNARSLLNILGMAIGPGEEIEILAKGEDEKEAVEALKELIEKIQD